MENRKKELMEMMEALDAKNEINYIEGAFRYYIDNQITDKELDFLLKEKGEVLPDEFFEMPVRFKKKYFTHTETRVKVVGNEYMWRTDETFNHNYFYRLAEGAKKNKTLTATLIDYVKEIGCDMNILFLGMQHIKLGNVKPTLLSDKIKAYWQKHEEIVNVYDLITSIYKGNNLVLKSEASKLLGNHKLLQIPIDDIFFQYILLMECLFSELPKKDANTLKIKFLILEPFELRDGDFYHDGTRQKKVINSCKEKLKKNMTLKRVNEFVANNQKWYEGMDPNGYFAAYKFLLAE